MKMSSPTKPVVYVYPDIDGVSRAAARVLVDRLRSAAESQGRCALALSGGNTPRALYRLLATEFASRVPWRQVDLFWGDERYVPADDPRSNFRMVKETLLDHIAIPPTNVHPMVTAHPDADDAARDYDRLLGRRFPGPWPRLDMILLGLAADGHIASLFPASPALEIADRRVVAVRVPADPPRRLTVTLPVINHATAVFFLVAGRGKAGAVHRVVVGPCDPITCPAVGVRPDTGDVVWWVDEAAATFLGPSVRAPSPPG
jgi:6-phosphogluconolactonase